MSAPLVSERAVERLGRILLEKVGLRPTAESIPGLKLALQARMEARGEVEAEAYVARLETAGDELRELLPLVTVGKTEFFRDAGQFRALRGQVIHELLKRARREMRMLRIWSAGCATGEEPYSLAIVLAELGVEPDVADILATDVNPQAVQVAAAGRFTPRRLSGLPAEMLARHFVREGEGWEASPRLRGAIRFATQNLAGLALYPTPRDAPPWDLILCRNVLIYFDREGMVRVVSRFRDALSEGGYLALGYSESLFRVDVDFELAEIAGAFVYRKPPAARPRPAPAKPEEPRPRRPTPPPARTEPPRPPPATSPAPPPPVVERFAGAAREPLEAANALLEQGQFLEASRLLEGELERAPGNLALLLTHGNARLILRDLKGACLDYRKALEIEPLCAEAHLFLGIACSEQGSDGAEEAARELSRAIFLDPHLALAHYYAGRLAERRGDLDGARRAYRNAIEACRGRKPAPMLGVVPDLPADPTLLARAASYALAALEERRG